MLRLATGLAKIPRPAGNPPHAERDSFAITAAWCRASELGDWGIRSRRLLALDGCLEASRSHLHHRRERFLRSWPGLTRGGILSLLSSDRALTVRSSVQ